MEFRARESAVKAQMATSMRSLASFWSELLTNNPNISQLGRAGERAQRDLDIVVDSFERLLHLHADSPPTLRAYALFCAEITGETKKAAALLARAEELEKAKNTFTLNAVSGEFLHVLSHKLDLFDPNNGV